MEIITKYPRTPHIEGSRIQIGDEDLKKISFDSIKGKFIVIEEKVDGANCGISFDINGKMYLQSRGHFLNGGYGERQFDLFKSWANAYKYSLYQLLGSRYVMYGEWLYAKHTVFYDRLPHYFMEFDIYDKEEKIFLSTQRRREILSKHNYIVSVKVLYEGLSNKFENITKLLGKSNFKSKDWMKSLERSSFEEGLNLEVVTKQTDLTDLMEGLYIKVEDLTEVKERCKYVRKTFINTILDSETHWMNRPILPNRLKEDINLFK